LNTSPVAVEYSITELGKTLQIPFGAMYRWSIDHLSEIESSQGACDQNKSVKQAVAHVRSNSAPAWRRTA
jgi:DNA-binding HxlR family transcriptional regulator